MFGSLCFAVLLDVQLFLVQYLLHLAYNHPFYQVMQHQLVRCCCCRLNKTWMIMNKWKICILVRPQNNLEDNEYDRRSNCVVNHIHMNIQTYCSLERTQLYLNESSLANKINTSVLDDRLDPSLILILLLLCFIHQWKASASVV